MPYPTRISPEPGTTHQIDMVGPRHLDGAVEFHALNLIDVGSHRPQRDPRRSPPDTGGRRHGRAENTSFVAFHNRHHRYSAHGGASPDEVWAGRLYHPLAHGYEIPTSLPAKGRIEVIRYARSNRVVDLFGKRLTLAEEHTHQYVTAIIKVRAKQVTVVTINGETVHDGSFAISRLLR